MKKYQAGYTIIEIFAVIQILVVLSMLVTWVINLFQLLNCDFYSPWRDEIIHGIGLLVPPASLITVWM